MELEKLEDALPSPNLSIDIFSLTNTNYESDESFDEFDQIDLKESVNRGTKGDEQELNRFVRRSSQAHYKYTFPSAKIQHDFCSNFDNYIVPDNVYYKNNVVSSENENVGNYLSPIYVYLNSLSSEKDLHKYFRPCHTCKKTYCICSDFHYAFITGSGTSVSIDLLASYNIPVLSLDSSKRLQRKKERKQNFLDKPTLSTLNSMKLNQAVETDVNITGFDSCRYKCLSFPSCKLLNVKRSSECLEFESYRKSSGRNSRTNFSTSPSEWKRDFRCQTWIYEHSTHGHLDSGIDTKASFDWLREP